MTRDPIVIKTEVDDKGTKPVAERTTAGVAIVVVIVSTVAKKDVFPGGEEEDPTVSVSVKIPVLFRGTLIRVQKRIEGSSLTVEEVSHRLRKKGNPCSKIS